MMRPGWMQLSRCGFIAIVSAMFVAPAAGQQTFRSRADVVSIPTAVLEKGHPVQGLTAADFELRDNGVLQTITRVSADHVPVDLTLLLDLSGSVDAALLDRLKAAVRSTVGALLPDDRVRLLALSHVLHEVSPFSPPGAPIPLDALSSGGATSLYDGLAAAMMHRSTPDRRQLIVAFTDGRDSTSVIDPPTLQQIAELTDAVVAVVLPAPPPSQDASGHPVQASSPLLAQAGQANVVARSSITHGSLPAEDRGDLPKATLTGLVSPTGGLVATLGEHESIADRLDGTLSDFRASYILQYVPQGVPGAGWHDVTVSLKKPGKHEIRSRKGYVADR